ncbi:MAG: hypothetical protein VKL42_14980 [Snowella sp.]|nr:hypothetical protein [Snowella sp.]
MYQTTPPLSPRETLPTMYDLPSEDPEKPGLPDEFHLLQPELFALGFLAPQLRSGRLFYRRQPHSLLRLSSAPMV